MLRGASRNLAVALFCVVLALSSYVWAEGVAAPLYKANCVVCHAADGSGNSPSGKALKAKDLRSDEVQKKSDAELADGIAKGQGKMPAFGKKLKPEQIQQLVSYVRQLAKNR
jgi:mono/diheme cytochrome c family protein